MLNHNEYIALKLSEAIKQNGIIKVGINLNDYFNFPDAENYAKQYSQPSTEQTARQQKSSADSVLGKLVEEVIIYLLSSYFQTNKFDYIVVNDKNANETVKYIVNSLKIERRNSHHIKYFDSDILIYNNSNFEDTKRVFILSAKGTTRERIGQFLSHLFLMDQDVLNAKYGKNKYEVIFTKENIKLKYGFVTLDWAVNKDFSKRNDSGTIRKTVKNTEVQLILDDVKLGGGIYVLNNMENLDGIGNFASLVGKICDYLR
ncbi:MAG: hypothetical protein ABFD00_05360 [Chloroherpetonaceae bacterium]